MRWQIRDARADDDDVLRALHCTSSFANAGDRALLLAHPEVFDPGGVAAHVDTRVAETDRIIGFATAVRHGDAMELEALFVDPDHMRLGVGRDLVDDVVARARTQGATAIEVTGNEHALAFYERLGFVVIGSVDTPLGVTALRLRLALTALD